MQLTFEYKNLTIGEWRKYLERSTRSNWMQSWPYVYAQKVRDFKNPRFVVVKFHNEEIGFFSYSEIKLGPIHFVEINRGPLWFQKIDINIFDLFCKKLRKTFPKKFLTRLRWIPECIETPEALAILKKYKFKKLSSTYSTVWIDLSEDSNSIEKKFHPKWRNALRKAENANIKIILDSSDQKLTEFLNDYSQYKTEKNYRSSSVEFMKAEYLAALPTQDNFLLWAYKDEVPIAGMMIARHGKSASYRIGWNSLEGRKLNAHYLLIWEAIQILKTQGVLNFDLGGTLPKEAPGLTLFKKRTGGEFAEHIGLFS